MPNAGMEDFLAIPPSAGIDKGGLFCCDKAMHVDSLPQLSRRKALMTFQRDSIFYDSPLNDVGMKQGADVSHSGSNGWPTTKVGTCLPS